MKYVSISLSCFGVSFSIVVILAIYCIANHDYDLGMKITPYGLPIVLGAIGSLIYTSKLDERQNLREDKQ